MAIVEMQKLKLYGASADKQKVLNALFETQLVTLKNVDEIENTDINFNDEAYTMLENKRAKLERAITTIEASLETLPKKQKPVIEKDFDLTCEEFEKIVLKQETIQNIISQIDVLLNKQNDIKKERTNLENRISSLTPYLSVPESFNDFKPTKNVSIMLGILPINAMKDFNEFLRDCPLTTFETAGDGTILKIYSHNSESFLVTKKLNELGFNKANFDLKTNAEDAIKTLNTRLKELEQEELSLQQSLRNFKDSLKELKTMHDYIKFCMTKEDAENKFRSTKQAFVLEAYLAKESREKLDKKLSNSNLSIEYEFLEIDKNEIPPTITKNNKVVKQFEFVTNMYSAPNYREFDPNIYIAFFFSVFFGFVMADIGYGLILIAFGLFMALRQKRNTGFKQLMFVIAVGGIFTVIFGALFGSFFGLGHEQFFLVPPATIPDPVNNVLTLLVSCLVAGIVQMIVSLILKGILLIKQKQILNAIFTAFCWDFFLVGVALFLLEYGGMIKGVTTIALIIAGVSAGIGAVGQIFTNKGFNRVSKSFGALYGIINFFSDILSYARLFGLMLSGAIIASIVNDLASGFLTSAATFLPGVIILAIGHGFNISMGALGGYIHVARLQYIEFFSRFYVGEGEIFVPFGTDLSYVKLK